MWEYLLQNSKDPNLVEDIANCLHEQGFKFDGEHIVPIEENKGNKGGISNNIKEGDWVVYQNETFQVVRSGKSDNLILQGRRYQTYFIEELCRPWTIEDAKNGDVLKALPIGKLGGQIFIFKGVSNRDYAKNCIDFHCRVYKGCFHAFEDGYMGVTEHSEDIRPATDEERDLLFIKMKEAGYEWDAEHKQLLKLSNVERNGKNCKEAASEDLEQEIIRYVGYPKEVDEDISTSLVRKAAHHFANWQKEQMMKDAVNGGCFSYRNGYKHISCDIDEHLTDIELGDKVKLIIIKED